MKFINQIEAEIKKSGLDYEFRYGKRHIKIIICGIFCGISPADGKGHSNDRAAKNILSQVRRQIRKAKEDEANRKSTTNAQPQLPAGRASQREARKDC